MKDVTRELQQRAKVCGFDVQVCAAGHLDDLRDEITARIGAGEVDAVFAGERLGHFDFSPTINGARPHSLIITAVRQPQALTLFHRDGREFRFPVPPTYDEATDEVIAGVLREVLEEQGYGLFPARLPYKLLAVRTGLARYGRNNITYHREFGSYFRLQTFLSDLPVEGDSWTEKAWLPECANCSACVHACPTGAISTKRAVIRAERCLTYFNEREEDFPDWVKPEWNRCLIGCMQCQRACPADRDLDIEPGEPTRFDEAETDNLLAAQEENEMMPTVREKLATLGLLEDHRLVARNLRMLTNVNQHS